MDIECPICMPKHHADLAQSEEWRDEHGVRSEGWLHPSKDRQGWLHCNCCGAYFDREPISRYLFDVHGNSFAPQPTENQT